MMKKVVLVTGASRGIGREVALSFGREGYSVAVNYIEEEEKALEVVGQLEKMGVEARGYKCDVSIKKDVVAMVKSINDDLGDIHVLVNNAGIAEMKLFEDISEEYWDRIFAVNVKGMFNTCQAVMDQMVSRKSGKIINTSSIWGMVGASCEVHYSATKGAIISFTKALAKEKAMSNIQVNCVAPGGVLTDMISGNMDAVREFEKEIPLGRIGQVTDVANVVLFLASEKADYITGQVISPNGGVVI